MRSRSVADVRRWSTAGALFARENFLDGPRLLAARWRAQPGRRLRKRELLGLGGPSHAPMTVSASRSARRHSRPAQPAKPSRLARCDRSFDPRARSATNNFCLFADLAQRNRLIASLEVSAHRSTKAAATIRAAFRETSVASSSACHWTTTSWPWGRTSGWMRPRSWSSARRRTPWPAGCGAPCRLPRAFAPGRSQRVLGLDHDACAGGELLRPDDQNVIADLGVRDHAGLHAAIQYLARFPHYSSTTG